MQWSSVDTGPEACHARTLTKIHETCPDDSTSGPSSRRQATVENDSWLGVGGPLPDAKAGVLFEEEVPRVPGREEDSETSDENLPLSVPKLARVVSGRQHHRPSTLVHRLMCRDGRSEESLLKRRAVTTLAARRNCQLVLGAFVKFVKERALHLDEDVEVNDARVVYPNDSFFLEVQHHHGSQLLAAVMDR